MRMILHEDWDPITMANDICLLELGAEADTSSGMVNTVDIAAVEADLGTRCKAGDWDGGAGSYLYKVCERRVTKHHHHDQIEYPVADCECDAYGDLIGPGMMCAGLEQGGVGICNSPMGTPLYCGGEVDITDDAQPG